MKISSASKKVLASALSAAMVVAFAPVTAFAATTAAETEEAAIAAGYTVKLVTTDGAFSATGANTYYYKTLAAASANVPGTGAGSITLLGDQELEAGVGFNNAVAIDLNGYKITNTATTGSAIYGTDSAGITLKGVKDGSEIANTNSANKTAAAIYVSSVKGGTYGAIEGKLTSIEGATFNGAVTKTDAAKLTVKGGTFNKGIVAKSATNGIELKGEVKIANAGAKDEKDKVAQDIYGIDAPQAAITVAAGANVEVTSATTLGTDAKQAKRSSTGAAGVIYAGDADAYGIVAKSVEVAINSNDKTVGALTVTATADGREQTATGILAADAVTTAKDAEKKLFGTIKVNAATSGVAASTSNANYNVATAVYSTGAEIYGTESALTASVKDDAANAYALAGDGAIYTAGGTYKTDAGEKKGYAVRTTQKFATVGGTYEGIISAGTYDIKGGTFSTKVTPAENYQCVDNGTAYVVSLKKATVGTPTVSGDLYHTDTNLHNANVQLVKDAAQSVVDALTEGATTVQGFAFAEGKDAAALVKDFEKYTTPNAKAEIKPISKRTATDAENAAIAAFDKYATDNLSQIVTDSYSSVAINLMSGDGKTALGTITDLGTTRGVANALTVELREGKNGLSKILAFDGTTVTELDYTKKDENTVKLPANAVALAIMTIDNEALKDAINQQPETPAVEKATQGIDVSKKSRTVKLAKGKTKTQKALYFKMGASAETALTTAKKSGSSRITVSGDKVTLKKGTKKGTYTAKVSLKAASSAEYLAAAKTITVKFVVKK